MINRWFWNLRQDRLHLFWQDMPSEDIRPMSACGMIGLARTTGPAPEGAPWWSFCILCLGQQRSAELRSDQLAGVIP